MTHEEVRDALWFYAAGATDASTRKQVDIHLRDCSECQQALRDAYHMADALARSGEQVQPRPALRQHVLDSIVGAQSARAAHGHSLGVEPSGAGRWHWLAAAAALVAILTSVGLLYARRELADVRRELVTWQLRVAQAEERAVRASNDAASQRRVVAVLTSTDLIETTLTGLPPAPGSRGRAFLSRSTGAIVFTAHGLPPVPANRVYQLWAIVGSTPVSAGVFTPEPDGRSQLITQLPALSGPPTTLAVTLEPEGGVLSPTGAMYLAGAQN